LILRAKIDGLHMCSQMPFHLILLILSNYGIRGNNQPICLSICPPVFLFFKLVSLSVFTALHGMRTRYSDEKAVRPFVRLSNGCTGTKRKKDLSIFSYHTKDILA